MLNGYLLSGPVSHAISPGAVRASRDGRDQNPRFSLTKPASDVRITMTALLVKLDLPLTGFVWPLLK